MVLVPSAAAALGVLDGVGMLRILRIALSQFQKN
jgi:hypothetical protein